MILYAPNPRGFLMNRCLYKLAFSIAFLWTFSLHANDKSIRVRADTWCPYNCDPLSHIKQGSMIEILRHALEPAGYTIDYDVMPWEESLNAGRKGDIDAVVGLTMADGGGFQLPSEPQGIGITCFYGKKGGPLDRAGFRLSRIEQLLSQRIVVPSGYLFVESLQKHLDTYKDDSKKILWVSSSWPLVDAYRAVFSGEADLFPENEAVINNLMISLGIRGGGQIVSLGCLEGENLYVGFSQKRADASILAELVSKKMGEMRKSGELSRILTRYGQKDWGRSR
jgi:polar amino acid transport system substrate-binding protein